MEYKDTITFYYKGVELNTTESIEHSDKEIRLKQAKDLGIDKYDRFVFKMNGVERMDSDTLKWVYEDGTIGKIPECNHDNN